MHPAYSVILFTTASGAGYGLLVWLALLGMLGLVPPDSGLGLVGIASALALITAGLLASTAHLGRPERAWRAFSQWRTSWLSREGVLAVATYIPAGLLALGWVVLGRLDWPVRRHGPADRRRRVGHAPRHRHDLRLAAHHPPMAPAPHRADLHRARPRQRRRAAQSAAAVFRLCQRRHFLARRHMPDHHRRPQMGLLAGDRRRAAHVHRRGGHRPRRTRQGAPARAAAHPAQLRHARDGLPGRPQARAPAAQPGDAARLRRAHCRFPTDPGAGRRLGRRCAGDAVDGGWDCWSSAGCSSPKPSTSPCSTTAPMLRKHEVAAR